MRYAPGEARDWVRSALRGYLAVLYTPFAGDGSIDEDGLRHNVRRTLDLPGVGGLSVNSLHQEFWTFTEAERKRLVRIVLETVDGRVPVVVGCSDPSAERVVDFARHAAAAGADLVMAWPPFYGPRSAESVRHFYEYVAGRVGIGLVLYSTTLPELGYYLSPPEVEALLPLRAVCAVQNTTLNLAQYAAMLERVGDRLPVATSLEEYHLFGRIAFPGRAPGFLIGSSRPVLCQTAAHPHCGRFIAALEAGELKRAAAQVRTILAIADRIQSRSFAQGFHHVGLFKHVAGCLGMATGTTRPGVAAASAPERAEAEAILRDLGFLAGDAARC